MAGVALGLVPGGGIGVGVLSAAGVLNQGTKAAEIGKSLGEIAGGAVLMLFGGGGTVAGAVATMSGVGTAAGVPAVVGSAALVAGGAGNIAAGVQGLTQALSTGGGSGGGQPSSPGANPGAPAHYPNVVNPRTGNPIPFPKGVPQRVERATRAPWGLRERGEFIAEWYRRGYKTPVGGWYKYDIHHILPREYGGTNDFWNLVPVGRGSQHELFNAFWRQLGL